MHACARTNILNDPAPTREYRHCRMMDDVRRWESLGMLTWCRLFSKTNIIRWTSQQHDDDESSNKAPTTTAAATATRIQQSTRASQQQREVNEQRQEKRRQRRPLLATPANNNNTTKEMKKKQCTRQTRQRRTDERQRDTPLWRRGSRYLRRACGRWRWLASFPTCAATAPASKFN